MKNPMQAPSDPDKPGPTNQPSHADTIEADICVIGAGPGGVALAIAAAAYGQPVVLVEKHKTGGLSLNYGSVPAVALAAAAERAQAIRSSQAFGVQAHEPEVDRQALVSHIREVIAAEAPNFATERLTGLGVQVIQASARFIDPRTVVAGQYTVKARRFVIATGSVPVLPDMKGLDSVAYFTTDSIYDCREPIDHLIIVGGGAAGIELAQAQRRLGARVTVVEQGLTLHRYDPELAAVVRDRLIAEGVVLLENARAVSVEATAGRVRVEIANGASVSRLEGSHLLIACGRRPAIADLGLTQAKITHGTDGIKINRALRTSNRRVYALGDVTGLPYSTHRAHYHAQLLTQTLLFRHTTRGDRQIIPTALHTDPELATVGLSEQEARAKTSALQVLRWPMRENARALTLRAPDGHIKIIAEKGGRILGVAIVSKSASELIQVWALAITRGLSLDDMDGWIAPYPSLGELSRTVGTNQTTTPRPNTLGRRWVKFLAKMG